MNSTLAAAHAPANALESYWEAGTEYFGEFLFVYIGTFLIHEVRTTLHHNAQRFTTSFSTACPALIRNFGAFLYHTHPPSVCSLCTLEWPFRT